MLELWKHIHISRLQREHNIGDSVVEDIVPLTAAALLNRPERDEEKAPTISERIEVGMLIAKWSFLISFDRRDDHRNHLPGVGGRDCWI